MASRIPPHVTLVYPEEASNERLLLERAADAAAVTAPFSIWFDAVVGGDRGHRGVWFPVVDPSDTWGQLRRTLLEPPFNPSQMQPHATVVHPRTSTRGAEALARLRGSGLDGEARLREIVFTETGYLGTEILDRFSLAADPPVRMVAGLLRRGDKVLMCHRRPDRDHFPDCWDLPGGHIEEGEMAADTLVRELDEELGIRAEPPEGAPWKTLRSDDFELSVFLVDLWEEEPRNAAIEEHDSIRWVGVHQLAGLQYADQVYMDILQEALR